MMHDVCSIAKDLHGDVINIVMVKKTKKHDNVVFMTKTAHNNYSYHL